MDASSTKGAILVVGGGGVFGSRVVAGLIADGFGDVVVAGRKPGPLAEVCRRHGGRAVALDRDDPRLAEHIAALSPFLVIDAAGPFQLYGSPLAVAEAAIACGAHYLDLSDDAAFTAGIAALDDRAKSAGLVVLSGVSSVPALSSAAVEALAADLIEIAEIESVILPGNRAPRGRSVVAAILSQVGCPLPERSGGRSDTVLGWGEAHREVLEIDGVQPLSRRWSSPIGAPDRLLFPQRYAAASVRFRAGLELAVLHLPLVAFAALLKRRLLPPLAPAAGVFRWLAERVERFGTDRGGMRVRVVGRQADGAAVERSWTMIAEAGDGPHVPALPARILAGKIARGEVAPGARACLGEFTLAEAEAAAGNLSLSFGRAARPVHDLFPAVLGENFKTLPAEIRDLHTVIAERRWSGLAVVERGSGFLAQLVCRLVGFPRAGAEVPIVVTVRREGDREIWRRDFAGQIFGSVLSPAGAPGEGRIAERFGPLSFVIALEAGPDGLAYPVARGTAFGIPIPRFLLPKSQSREYVGEGRFRFDVALSLPLAGRVVRYRGWLAPQEPEASAAAGAPLLQSPPRHLRPGT